MGFGFGAEGAGTGHNSKDPPFLLYKTILLLSYAALVVFLSFRIFTHCRRGHSRRSFTFGLLVMCLSWGLLRTIFWLGTILSPAKLSGTDTFSVVWIAGLYWVPFAAQFTSYSLFALFLGKVVHRRNWKQGWKKLFHWGFVGSNLLLLIFVTAWAVRSVLGISRPAPPPVPHPHPIIRSPSPSSGSPLILNGNGQHLRGILPNIGTVLPLLTPSSSSSSSRAHHGGGVVPWQPTHPGHNISDFDVTLHWVMGFAFAALSVVFGWLSLRYLAVDSQHLKRMLLFQPRQLALLNLVCSIVFISRALVNFLDATDPAWGSLVNISLDGAHDVTQWACLLMLVWEIVPTVLFLAIIARQQGSRRASIPSYGAFHQISTGTANAPLVPGNSFVESNQSEIGEDNSQPIEAQRRWLEGGSLFDDPSRYDSLPSDSILDDRLYRGPFASIGSTPGKSLNSPWAAQLGSQSGSGSGSDASPYLSSFQNSHPHTMHPHATSLAGSHSQRLPSSLGKEQTVRGYEGAPRGRISGQSPPGPLLSSIDSGDSSNPRNSMQENL